MPIVVLTGVDDENTGVEAMRTGVQDYLVKGQTDGRTITRVIRYSIERKNAEDALRERERLLQDVMDSSTSPIFLKDRDGKFIAINTSLERMLGISRQELKGKTDYDIAPKEVADYWRSNDTKVMTTGKAIQIEEVADLQDGHHIFLSNKFPLVNSNGQVYGVGAISHDITERKKTEEELQKLASVVRHSSEFVNIAALDGKMVFINEAGAEMIGLSAEEVERTHILQVIPDHLQDKVKNEVLPTLKENGLWQGELQYRNLKTGRLIDVYATTFVVKDPDKGTPLFLANTSIDITECKKAEEAIKRAATRFEILSGTAAKLLESKQPQQIVNFLCSRVMEYLDCHIFVNYLVDEQAHRLHLNSSGGLPEKMAKDIEWLDFGQAICGRVAQEGKRIVAENIQESCDARADLVRSVGIRAYACHPIMTQGKVIGTLSFGTRSRKTFSDDDLATMETVTNQVATAMERMRAEETLRKAHDELDTRVKERTAELGEMVLELQKQILQRVKAEETVKAERKRFENVLEMMPAYAVLLTPDYHVAYANRTFREWFGDDNGKKCYEFLFNRTEPCENCQTYNVMKTGKSQFWEWTGPNGKNYDIYDYPFADTDGSPLIMEIGVDVTAHKQTQTALRSTSLYARGLLEASLDPLVTISPEGKITDINRATELVTGLSREGLIGSDFSDYFTEPQKAKEVYKKVLAEGMVKDYPLTIRHISGHTTDVVYNATLYKNEAGQVQGVFAAARDVTEHNRIENRDRITNVLLELFAQKSTRKEYLDSVVRAVRDWSGCQCVGIRLTNSDGLIPYESHIGFNKEFLASESVLSLKTDTCACMRVITQKPEPQDAPVMTSKGSFRCDNTLEFFNSLPEKKKARYRGYCMRHGFASLAVVPIRYRDKVLGAIHLADKTGKQNSRPKPWNS